MGMFMASVAFRCKEEMNLKAVRAEVEKCCDAAGDLVHNLDQDLQAYAVVSPYGESGAILAELAQTISTLIDDYAVMAVCVDSDLNMLDLYHQGIKVESCAIGVMYEEFEIGEPDLENWKPLLLNPDQEDALREALFEEEVFAEDNLRKLSKLTGLPIFDDELIMGG